MSYSQKRHQYHAYFSLLHSSTTNLSRHIFGFFEQIRSIRTDFYPDMIFLLPLIQSTKQQVQYTSCHFGRILVVIQNGSSINCLLILHCDNDLSKWRIEMETQDQIISILYYTVEY